MTGSRCAPVVFRCVDVKQVLAGIQYGFFRVFFFDVHMIGIKQQTHVGEIDLRNQVHTFSSSIQEI